MGQREPAWPDDDVKIELGVVADRKIAIEQPDDVIDIVDAQHHQGHQQEQIDADNLVLQFGDPVPGKMHDSRGGRKCRSG